MFSLRTIVFLGSVGLTLHCMQVSTSGQILYESADGSGSIALDGAGTITANFADASAKLAYTWIKSTSRWRLGGEAKFKSTEGYSQLFAERRFSQPETGVDVFVGRSYLDASADRGGHDEDNQKEDKYSASILYILVGVQGGYRHAEYDVATSSSNNEMSLNDITFDGAVASLLVNLFGEDILLPNESLVGVRLTYGRRNNYEQLPKVEICETLLSGTANGNPAAIQQCKNTRVGSFEKDYKVSFDLDWIWYQGWAENRFSFSGLVRFDDTKTDHQWSYGIGAFVNQDGKPMRVIGGLTGEIVDDKFRVGLQAGFPF